MTVHSSLAERADEKKDVEISLAQAEKQRQQLVDEIRHLQEEAAERRSVWALLHCG